MNYFKIDGAEFSYLVSGLKVGYKKNYNAQTNAAGNTVVDLINIKRVLEVSFIPMDDIKMQTLLSALTAFTLNIRYRDPESGAFEDISCFFATNEIDYYTIQQNKINYKGFSLTFEEL